MPNRKIKTKSVHNRHTPVLTRTVPMSVRSFSTPLEASTRFARVKSWMFWPLDTRRRARAGDNRRSSDRSFAAGFFRVSRNQRIHSLRPGCRPDFALAAFSARQHSERVTVSVRTDLGSAACAARNELALTSAPRWLTARNALPHRTLDALQKTPVIEWSISR